MSIITFIVVILLLPLLHYFIISIISIVVSKYYLHIFIVFSLFYGVIIIFNDFVRFNY